MKKFEGKIKEVSMEIPITSDEDRKLVLQEANRSIFRPVDGDSKFTVWIKKHINDYLRSSNKAYDRFMTIHRSVKVRLIHPLLLFIEKKFKGYLVKDIDDIPRGWYNNHLRIYYDSFSKGLEDMWGLQHYLPVRDNPDNKHIRWAKSQLGLTKRQPTMQEYVTVKVLDKGNLSQSGRMRILNIWMTEVLEDSIDREWFNFSIMRMTHSMMELYGVSEDERKKVPRPGEFPIYSSVLPTNPPYFVLNRNRPVWQERPSEYILDLDKIKEDIRIEESVSAQAEN